MLRFDERQMSFTESTGIITKLTRSELMLIRSVRVTNYTSSFLEKEMGGGQHEP